VRRWDYVIAAAIVALCAFAVERQLSGHAVDGPAIRRLDLGDTLEPDWVLKDVTGADRELHRWLGAKATVLYSWKTSCPCVDVVEPRLRHLSTRFGRQDGIAWVAVDGEAEDEPAGILDKMGRIQAFYGMLLDPEQRLSARLGFDRATLVVVLDGAGRLRYRGAIDDSYESPKRSYLEEALEAVVAGREPATAETEPVYGCEYSGPPSCPVETGGT
jgi:hypothetical protein